MSINKQFMAILREKYLSLKDGESVWRQEKDKVEKILAEIEKELNGLYEIKAPINIGGLGIVLEVTNRNLDASQALKCARPIAEKEFLTTKILTSEISHLIESAHPNIVPIYYKNQISKFGRVWPFYIMEYIEDAVDALKYLEKEQRHYSWVIQFIKQVTEGIVFLHSRQILHGDIKLENVLISPDGNAKISDLGSARLLSSDDKETLLTFTRQFAHPDLRGLSYESSMTDPNRNLARVNRAELREVFDLYAFGKNILRILGMYDIADQKNMPSYYRSYLDLMGCRMLDGKNESSEQALNLPRNAFEEIKYHSASEVLVDIKKIIGQYSIHKEIPEMNHHFPSTIQISSSASTSFTKRLASLITLPIFRRLSRISQLGLIVQIYPTATHSRQEHVLGTFANVVRYCDALWNDPINPLFKQIISKTEINAVLLAALCHDLGQYPLAHDLEEADSTMFSHKEISLRLLTEFKDISNLEEIIKGDWEVDPDLVVEILSTDPTDLNKPLKSRLLHTLINGPIDADKIDYIIRDSNNLNVTYGKAIDFERLLKCLTIVFKEEGANTFISLGIHEKGKIPAESVAFSRYAMFGAVYWHHTSRSLKSMLHRAIWEIFPKTDRRSSEYKTIQKSFYDEIFRDINVGESERLFPELFLTASLPSSPQLALTDYLMLVWIHNETSAEGKKLLEMICKRQFFKRLLVISASKNIELWTKLIEFRKTANWNEMKIFQSEVQRMLIELISAYDDERSTSILSQDKTDEIVGRASSGEILFLVDIPCERKSSPYSLHFLSESRIHGPIQSTQDEDRIQMEDSLIWLELSKGFLKSVGKIRVFCHPDIVETCSACLSRNSVENILNSVHRYVTK